MNPVAPSILTETAIAVSADGTALDVVLTRPDAPGRAPVALFVTGAGAVDADYVLVERGRARCLMPVAELGERLARRGIACVRWAKRGVAPGGHVGGGWKTATVEALVADARAVAAWAERDDRLDATRLAVAAHSEGTQIATRAFGRHPAVRAFALLGLGNDNGWVMMAKVFAVQTRCSPEDAEAAMAKLRTLVASAPDDLVLAGFPAGWWREHADAVPLIDAWRGLSTPVLVQHGLRDVITTYEAEAAPFLEALRASGHPDVSVVTYPALDHFFTDAEGASRAGDVFDDLVAWLAPRLAP